MAANSMDIECSSCNEQVRKDTLLVHIKKNHPSYLWDHIFCTYHHINPEDYTLRNTRNIRTAISILEDNQIPYELDDEVFIDFATKTAYKRDSIAVNHILDHPVKHRDNFFQMLKEGLTMEKMSALLKWIVGRRPRVIEDPIAINKLKEQIAERDETYRKNTLLYGQEMASLQACLTALQETEEQQQIAELKRELINEKRESRNLILMCNELQAELKPYRKTDREIEESNKKSLQDEQKEWDAYEKVKQQYLEKQTELDKKLIKAKEAFDKELSKITSAFEKKESKQKKEIKALKHQIKILKLKSEKLDSDSDSDSD